MKLEGRVWKDHKFWLVELPLLDLLTQGKSKKNALFMIKDAVELLINDKSFSCKIIPTKDKTFYLDTEEIDLLIPLILKRLRERNNLSIREVAERLGHKSHTAYARYETGKVKASLDKFVECVKVIDEHDLILKVG